MLCGTGSTVPTGTRARVLLTGSWPECPSATMTIRIESAAAGAAEEPRNTWLAMARGRRSRCPACGEGALFASYLKVTDRCSACGTELHHQRADDAPPYFTMVIVGHVVVGGVLALERAYAAAWIVHMLLWIPLTLGLSLWLLPQVKGALVGLQWALRMHGFGRGPDPGQPDPIPSTTSLSERGR